MHNHAVALITLASAVGAAAGGESPSDVGALQARIDQLEARLAQVEGGDQWLTEQRAAEIRGLVQDVLADADSRASLQASSLTAGWDKGFFLASPDGNYRLKVGGHYQFRFVYNNREDIGGDDERWGFENRRAKLEFSGHVVDPTWRYTVVGAFDRTGGAFILEDTYVDKDLGNGWNIKFGQFKAPFMKEELMSSKRQLAVDRSLVNEEFNQDRNQGVELGWKGDNLRAQVMYSDGFGFTVGGGAAAFNFAQAGSDNTSAVGSDSLDTEYAFTGRVEWMAAGSDWKQFDDFTSWREEEFGLVFGGAAHYEKGEYGTLSADEENEVFLWTVDGQAEFGGVNLFAALVGRHLDGVLVGAVDSFDQYGLVVQGGVFVTDDIEPFARYEWGDQDKVGVEDLNVVTIGVNKYFNKHNLKWTTDVGYAFDAVGADWAQTGVGYIADDTSPEVQDGQVVVRSQFQLLF